MRWPHGIPDFRATRCAVLLCGMTAALAVSGMALANPGMGGMGDRLPAEFSKEPHSRGAVSMARTNDPNSARSQFFICFKDANFLDGQYTVWGKVTSGMEFVDKIKRGDPQSGAVPAPPDRMIRVQVAADAKD